MPPKNADAVAPIPCLVCGKRLSRAKHGGRTNPKDGALFRTYGSSDSTLSIVTGLAQFAEVIVCDECLRTATADGRVLTGRPEPVPPPPPTKYTVGTLDENGQIVEGADPWEQPKLPWQR